MEEKPEKAWTFFCLLVLLIVSAGVKKVVNEFQQDYNTFQFGITGFDVSDLTSSSDAK